MTLVRGSKSVRGVNSLACPPTGPYHGAAALSAENGVAPMAEVVELLLTEMVARLTGGGGPGA